MPLSSPFDSVDDVRGFWFHQLGKAHLIRYGNDPGLFETNEWFYAALVCKLYCDFIAKPDAWRSDPSPKTTIKRFIGMVRKAVSDATPTQLSQQEHKNHSAALFWEHLNGARILEGGAQVGYGRHEEGVRKLITAFSRHIVASRFNPGPPCACGTEAQEAAGIVLSVHAHGWAMVRGQEKKLQPLV